MANYVRRIVSGNKARFKDPTLNVELDLVYLTDQVIIMGFPAAGIEGYYRNHRDDAKRFLEHRHGSNFWVFNFCPVAENSYPASTFGGRVSRYPFPDHHAPPLAILPLVAREVLEWLDGSPEHVAVLHCKAGKGRSGMLACAYLLAMTDQPRPPRLQRNYNASEWEEKANYRAAALLEVVQEESERTLDATTPTQEASKMSLEPPLAGTPSTYISPELESILALHTSRRMKQPKVSSSASSPASTIPAESESPKPKIKHGVSIPSQRRFLSYWSRILSGASPACYWGLTASDQPPTMGSKPAAAKVRLRSITIRMHEADGVKMTLVRAANAFLERYPLAKVPAAKPRPDENIPEKGAVWASLARYDDDFVKELEEWERISRNPDSVGRRGPVKASAGLPAALSGIRDEKWDKEKMVRSFARLAGVGAPSVQDKGVDGAIDSRILVHFLKPLSYATWVHVKQRIATGAESRQAPPADAADNATRPPSVTSFDESANLTEEPKEVEEGVILDASREVRVKLYMGRVWMGWLWFIPAFHMPPQDSSPQSSSTSAPSPSHQLLFTRKELDFPLGPGGWIVDVSVDLSWVPLTPGTATRDSATELNPPDRKCSDASVDDSNVEFVEAVLEGNARGAVEAKQGAED